MTALEPYATLAEWADAENAAAYLVCLAVLHGAHVVMPAPVSPPPGGCVDRDWRKAEPETLFTAHWARTTPDERVSRTPRTIGDDIDGATPSMWTWAATGADERAHFRYPVTWATKASRRGARRFEEPHIRRVLPPVVPRKTGIPELDVLARRAAMIGWLREFARGAERRIWLRRHGPPTRARSVKRFQPKFFPPREGWAHGG